MKVAIIHDWLVTYAGAERVLEEMIGCFSEVDIFSTVDFIYKNNRGFLGNSSVKTSFIQKFPFARKLYRHYLPFMPLAVEQFDLSKYDLILSSSHAVAKGVIVGPDQLHICLCHSPIRYAWDLQQQYLEESNLKSGLTSVFVRIMLHKIRLWDVRSSNGVDSFIAVSNFISRRIEKAYRRRSTVIYPPVDVEGFTYREDKEDFYFAASRLVPYKKMPLIVEAFSKMPNKRLIVIGEGPDFKKCQKIAGPNVILMGWQPFEVMRDHMQRAKAFVFAAMEDFGIVPLEAQACGTPVIAFAGGALRETIRGLDVHSSTGVFFYDQDVSSIVNAVDTFEKAHHQILPSACRENALQFSPERFRREFMSLVQAEWQAFLEHKLRGSNQA
jgi:glycosyltransferase involved in cell wall biosynthesis